AGIHLEAGVVCKRGIEQSKRVRKVNLLEHFERIPPADCNRSGRPLSHSVDRQYRRLVKGRGEERAGGMALMMFGEQQLLFSETGSEFLELAAEQILLE